VSSAEVAEKVVQNLMFFLPQIWRRVPKFLGGICKWTTRPTYWPSLVEIPWLVFIYADEILKKEKINYSGKI